MTIFPVSKKGHTDTPNIGKVLFWFPVVGLLIGLLLAASYVVLVQSFPFEVADALILMIYIFLIGGLHLDGLADTCDGIFGGRDREARLRIMRDSSIGSFGVLGLMGLIGIKYLCLHSINNSEIINPAFISISKYPLGAGGIDRFFYFKANHANICDKCIILLLMPSVGRWAQTLGASISIYARDREPGTGMLIIQNAEIRHAIYSAIIPFILTYLFCNIKGLIILVIIIFSSLIFVRLIRAKIGGMTGDTLGALNETAELIFLAAFLV